MPCLTDTQTDDNTAAMANQWTARAAAPTDAAPAAATNNAAPFLATSPFAQVPGDLPTGQSNRSSPYGNEAARPSLVLLKLQR